MSTIQQDDQYLPPTKIKRTYRCKTCNLKTTNPREHLKHRQNVHGDRVKIVECPFCVYACQYRQKLNRHLKLVHKIYQDSKPPSFSTSIENLQTFALNYATSTRATTTTAIETNAFISNYVDDNDGDDNDEQPLDLSFPAELKELIKIFETNENLFEQYQNQYE